MEARQWYYAIGGQQQGPVAEDTLFQMFATGQLTPETLVWTQGMQDWVKASAVEGLVPLTPLTAMDPLAAQASFNQGGFLLRSYAGFWKRFAAAIIDSIILQIGGFIGGFMLGIIMGGAMVAGGAGEDAIAASVSVFSFLTGIVLNWLYYTLMECSSKQATLGKMALGIIVTDLDGQPISFGKANGRYWGKIVSTLIFGIGFIMAGFTEKKQALHDIMAGCLVVNK